MARSREFDVEAVLDEARELFWSHGYQATSLDQLSRVTGVSKPSLYLAFGDKAELFRRVLERYHAMVLSLSKAVLAHGASARQALRSWLTSFLPRCTEELGERGCLSINTSLADAPALTPALRASIQAFQDETERALYETFERGRAQGEFPASFDSRAAARSLFIAQSGLMVLARSRPTAAATLEAMERLLEALLPPAPPPPRA